MRCLDFKDLGRVIVMMLAEVSLLSRKPWHSKEKWRIELRLPTLTLNPGKQIIHIGFRFRL